MLLTEQNLVALQLNIQHCLQSRVQVLLTFRPQIESIIYVACKWVPNRARSGGGS